MTEASQIARYIAAQLKRPIRSRDAKYLASFSFPLEEKLRLIRKIIEVKGAESIYSALYFSQAFIESESNWHKGIKGEKGSSFIRIGDVLSASSGAFTFESD